MGLVSSEPIVFIGPGSEWFWSMAQFVIVAVTLVGIYYQFRLQRAANAFEHLQGVTSAWRSERLLRARLRVARDIEAGKTPDLGAVGVIGDHWELVATLIRGGHVNADVVYNELGVPVRFWWHLLEEEVRRERGIYNPGLWANFEWLTSTFEQKAERDGTLASGNGIPQADFLRVLIRDYEGQIQLAEESRMVPTGRLNGSRPRSAADANTGSLSK